MQRDHTCSESDFKDFRAGDKIYIGGKDGLDQNVYFKSVFAGRLNYKDLNSREFSIELSKLCDTYKLA